MALGNCDSMVSRLFCPVRRSQNCEKCFGRNQRKATQSPHKAPTKPPQSHILGIDSGVQRHPKANLKPPQGHPTATPRLHQSHTKAWEVWPNDAAVGSDEGGNVNGRRGGASAHCHQPTTRSLFWPRPQATLRPPSGHLVANR